MAIRLAASARSSSSTRRIIQAPTRSFSSRASSNQQQKEYNYFIPAAALLAVGATAATITSCETTPSGVNADDVNAAPSLDDLPVYTMAELSKNNGENGTPVWMTYGGMVYDVTDFIANHPGGHEKILQAAGDVSLRPRFYSFVHL